MLLEHVAINVSDPVSMAQWYVDHCHMRIVLQVDEAPYTRFLADQKGRTCLEIYANPKADIPDYTHQHPLIYHQAFAVDDPDATRARLEGAGATFFEEVSFPNGTKLVMLRDPWGIPLQLVKRTEKWY